MLRPSPTPWRKDCGSNDGCGVFGMRGRGSLRTRHNLRCRQSKKPHCWHRDNRSIHLMVNAPPGFPGGPGHTYPTGNFSRHYWRGGHCRQDSERLIHFEATKVDSRALNKKGRSHDCASLGNYSVRLNELMSGHWSDYQMTRSKAFSAQACGTLRTSTIRSHLPSD
jgi:hypothetical protein